MPFTGCSKIKPLRKSSAMTDSMDCLKRCKGFSSELSSLIAAGGIRTAVASLFVITALPVMGKDLEFVVATGPNAGPRSK